MGHENGIGVVVEVERGNAGDLETVLRCGTRWVEGGGGNYGGDRMMQGWKGMNGVGIMPW